MSEQKEKELRLMEAMGEISDAYIEEALENNRKTKKKKWKLWAGAAAAVLALSILLPNLNAQTAYAMEQIPVLGAYFQAVTIREYTETADADDGNYEISVEEPALVAVDEEGSAAYEEANEQINAWTEEQVASFKEAAAESFGTTPSSLEVDYAIVGNTDRYYSIRLYALMTSADGYVLNKYVVYDMQNKTMVTLADLFSDDSYVDTISEEIKEQMRARMKEDSSLSYWIDSEDPVDDFTKISEDQDFYINEEDELVICFNEGDVAPSYMGAVEFVMPSSVWSE